MLLTLKAPIKICGITFIYLQVISMDNIVTYYVSLIQADYLRNNNIYS